MVTPNDIEFSVERRAEGDERVRSHTRAARRGQDGASIRDDEETGAINGCVLAPLLRIQSMNATYPSRAADLIRKTVPSYCGSSKPVRLMAR
jgi:hypothetical protein